MASVTARGIISDALSFHLNRLSPGETMEADLAGICLDALNSVCDELNGVKSYLFREVLTASSAITGAYGTLGTDWSGLASGEKILGATVRYGASEDVLMSPITMEQYQAIGDKTTTGTPDMYAHDGGVLVYLYPTPTNAVITLRTSVAVSEFTDLDTVHTLPAGYKSAFTALLAEKMAPSLDAMSPIVIQQAKAARTRIGSQVINPAILGYMDCIGSNILRGW